MPSNEDVEPLLLFISSAHSAKSSQRTSCARRIFRICFVGCPLCIIIAAPFLILNLDEDSQNGSPQPDRPVRAWGSTDLGENRLEILFHGYLDPSNISNLVLPTDAVHIMSQEALWGGHVSICGVDLLLTRARSALPPAVYFPRLLSEFRSIVVLIAIFTVEAAEISISVRAFRR